MTPARRSVVGALLLLTLAAGMALAVWGGVDEPGDGLRTTTAPISDSRISAPPGASSGQTTPTSQPVASAPTSAPSTTTPAPPMPTAGTATTSPDEFPSVGTTSSNAPRAVPRRGTVPDPPDSPPPAGDEPAPTTEPPPTTEAPTTTEPPTTTTKPPTEVLVILGEPCRIEGAPGLAVGGIPCICLPDTNGRARWVAS